MPLQRVFRLALMLIGMSILLLAVLLPPPGRMVAAASSASVHYIYADDGLCPDTISGYQITSSKLVPTPGSLYSAGKTSCTTVRTLGYNTLAVTPGNAVHGPCLVHSDALQPQVESFTINLATGALALVSTVAGLSSDLSAQAKDIRIAGNGNLVYVTVTPGTGTPGSLSSLTLGVGCTLKLDQQLGVSTKTYNSILLISASRLVAIDLSQTGIDSYALTPTGGIAFVNSVPGQLTGTEGVADQTFMTPARKQATVLYTGQFRLSLQAGSTAQAGLYTPDTGTFSPLATSPQTDSKGFSLDYLLYNTANHFLIGTETFSETLGVWSAPGSNFTFFGQAALPVGVSEPTTMTQIGTQLFVIGRGTANGVIARCTITPIAPGVKNCSIAANLSGSDGAVEGVAIL